MVVRKCGHRLDVEHVATGVPDGLAVEGLGVVANRALPRVQVIGVDPGEIDRHLGQVVLQLIHGAAVEGR